LLWFSAWPPSAYLPQPTAVAVPTPSEVVLEADKFSVAVPTVFDKAAQAKWYQVKGTSDKFARLFALSRKFVPDGEPVMRWYAQSATYLGSPDSTIRWNNWTADVTNASAEVCLLAVFGELPDGLKLSAPHGDISQSELDNLTAEKRAVRSKPLLVRFK